MNRSSGTAGNVGINFDVAAPTDHFPSSGAMRSLFSDLHPQGRDVVRFFTDSKVVITRWADGGTSAVMGVGQ